MISTIYVGQEKKKRYILGGKMYLFLNTIFYLLFHLFIFVISLTPSCPSIFFKPNIPECTQ